MVQMTAVEGADDNQKRFTFIVRDRTAECRDFTINLSASSTNATIYRDVAKMADYDHHSFELWWRHSNKDCSAEKLLDINSEQCLKDSELIPKYDVNDNARIFLALRKKNGVLPIKALNDEVKSHTWKSDSNIFRNNLNEERSRIGYVGLVNHAMTCYLNSLLQTLFMTPEWEFSCSKRFSFDYHTLQRMKLNDRVTFPYILNLSEFLEDQQTQLNYELFSIMIHSGSAVGGHYYAYIKSFDDNNWYCFNDQSVTQVNEQDIEKAYGGGEIRRYYTSMFASSSNAYMLMYRQIDRSRNSKFMDFGNFPPHINNAIENLKKEEDDHKRKLEYERMTYRFKLFGSHPIQKTLVEKKLEINKDITLREATKVAHKLLELENIVPLDRCRIVKYESCNELVDKSFEGLEEKTVEEAFEGIRPIFELLLEWCHEHQDFQTFKSDDMSIKLLEVNLEAGTVEDSVFVKIPYASKAYELADLTKKRLGLSEDDTIRFAQSSYTGLKLLDRQHDVHDYPSRACRLYIEYKDKEDAKEEFNNSKLFKVLDYHNNLITLHIKMALSQNQKNTTEVTKKIDKRMSLSEFKEFIQPDVGLPTNCFKVCRILGSGSEIEMMSTDETFSAQSSEVHLLIKPGRALEKGDHRVSLSWLDINSDRPVQFFTEEIIKEGSTAREFKSKISQQVNEAVGKEIPLSRSVFFILAEEAIVSMNQVPVLVRHWQPSTFTLGPYTEVILDSPASNDLFMKIAEISKLHVEDIVITLNYKSDLTNPKIIIGPRDKKEKAMELSAAKRDEIRRQENIKYV
ncbi:uncharacterized protein TRIADDRAFT_54793 [Trichoplax adhaerens]|uniref:Ubiquitin carboxyl-terminal hydrolase n=1 Tax=Trichoplax adhaerens TaxID=10228 RepID=B3RT07_TRIAD|nr:hypothetical protein TRIADDRAFT_54793 [Trichoplax adhaerens]EDV27142.1 hypothetical protein TRIADDRAFT_54793 [Trichoplax adhaerens]|eukprot:XP_002111138.1 hypothetical protein TRIADDRAFT_54793 [Trichoplax adhaerens]